MLDPWGGGEGGDGRIFSVRVKLGGVFLCLQDYLGLPLAGGWDHLGPRGRGREEGTQQGERGKGALGGRGGWKEEEGQEQGGGTD